MVRSQGLTIAKLAAAAGVGVETVRFYQRRDLLDTPTRNGAIRRYGSEHVRRLRFIRQAQAAGFTLAEVKELLDLDAGQDRARARQLAHARIESLNSRITELQAARESLEKLAKACASGGQGPCPIIASFAG